MARPTDLTARHALLDQVVTHLAEHGLSQATLRPMATAIGTTAGRLLHHFGSKEQLIVAALARLDEMERQIEARWLATEPDMSQSDILQHWWQWLLNSERHRNLARLGIEAATVHPAISGLAPDVRADRMGAWRQNIERRLVAIGVQPADASVQGSVLEAAFTGLVVDLLSGGDRARLTQALEWVLDDHERRVARLLG